MPTATYQYDAWGRPTFVCNWAGPCEENEDPAAPMTVQICDGAGNLLHVVTPDEIAAAEGATLLEKAARAAVDMLAKLLEERDKQAE